MFRKGRCCAARISFLPVSRCSNMPDALADYIYTVVLVFYSRLLACHESAQYECFHTGTRTWSTGICAFYYRLVLADRYHNDSFCTSLRCGLCPQFSSFVKIHIDSSDIFTAGHDGIYYSMADNRLWHIIHRQADAFVDYCHHMGMRRYMPLWFALLR